MPAPEYGPYHQVSSTPAAPQFDLNAAIAAFLMQQQMAQSDRTQLQRERSFGRNLGWNGPGGLTPQAKWDEMFGGANAQIGREQRALGGFGLQGVQAGLAPFQPNPEAIARHNPGTVMPEPTGYTPPALPTHPIPGGLEGMINPQAPNKFADSNTFTVRPGVAPSVPPGYSIADERGPYTPSKKKRPGSSFGFGATAARGFSM